MEEWRPIASHPGRYEVSNLGRVRATPREIRRGRIVCRPREHILAQAVGGRAKNYRRVMLCDPKRFAFVHALVAEAFLGPRPAGALILHRDDSGDNNRADNLRYGDRDENELDRHVVRVAGELEEAPF